MIEGRPQYRINLVSELTGVSEATLRAWERRYAFPKPERTPSGYRIYTPSDVDQVRRMRELCEAGIAPREAAKMIAQGAAGTEPAPAQERDPLELRFVELVHASHLNERNTLQVGVAMTWMEKAALVISSRQLHQRLVVVSSECVDYRIPLTEDLLAEVTALVDGTRDGTTTAIAEVLAEDPVTGVRTLALRGRFYLTPRA